MYHQDVPSIILWGSRNEFNLQSLAPQSGDGDADVDADVNVEVDVDDVDEVDADDGESERGDVEVAIVFGCVKINNDSNSTLKKLTELTAIIIKITKKIKIPRITIR